MLKSIKKYLSKFKTVFKYTVSFIALFYIGYRIKNTPFTSNDLTSILTPLTFLFIVLLTIGNWSFEILKWKIVVDTFSKISFGKATYQTLVAYTYGMITPFNSGNYAKKTFFFPKKHSKRIIFLNFSKGIYQMFVTVIFGSWAVFFLINDIKIQQINQNYLVLISAFLCLIIAFIFRKKIIELIKSISLKIHFELFLYSVIKFVCFSLLLVVLLYQKDLPVLKLYAGICAVYFITSLLPILNILDFAIKGSTALWVLSPLGYKESNILIAYFILWICNHAAPAITGSLLQFYNTDKKST